MSPQLNAVDALRKNEFSKSSRLFLLFIATPIYVIYIFVDIAMFGFRVDFLFIRVFFVIVCLTMAWRMKAGAFIQRAHLPILVALTWNVTTLSYQVAVTGGSRSAYVYGVAQTLCAGLILPFTKTQFFGVFAFGIFSQISAYAAAGAGDLSLSFPFSVFNTFLFYSRVPGSVPGWRARPDVT